MPRAKKAVVESETSEALVLTPEEVQAIQAIRAQGVTAPAATAGSEPKVAVSELAQALVTAIEATRPVAKKTPFNRKKGDPWQNKDGSPKSVLKRKMFQHGMNLNPEQLTSQEIELLNQVKPGLYCEGLIRVIKRRDRSLDIDYPIKTSAQRLKVANMIGASGLSALLQRLIAEKTNPTAYRHVDDEDDD